MVEVKFYENPSARKKNEVFGVFNIPIVPEVIPATSEELKDKFTTSGKNMYELAEELRNKKVEKAILECKERAINMVREYIPEVGVFVATLVEETKDSADEVIQWILEHKTLTEDFQAKFPNLYEKYKEEETDGRV